MVEFACKNDRNRLCALWQSVFLEDEKVTSMFFENVAENVIIPVIKSQSDIVSALFLIDCSIGGYKGKCVYCAMTAYSHRGKGYMRELLDFSYNYCQQNGFDFLILIPAEKSLFDYYRKVGFKEFGIRRSYEFSDKSVVIKEKPEYSHTLSFDGKVIEYWKNACVHYGGKIKDFGFVFCDGNIIIRNANVKYEALPTEYKVKGNIIQGNLDFGTDESPAMIRTEKDELKNTVCYIGITLE